MLGAYVSIHHVDATPQAPLSPIVHRPGKEICPDPEMSEMVELPDHLPSAPQKYFIAVDGGKYVNRGRALAIGEPVPRKICYCRSVCCVVVNRNRSVSTGRMLYKCARYDMSLLYPNTLRVCKYTEWVDPPMCRIGHEYALEMQDENERLKKEIFRLKQLNSDLESQLPRYPNE